MSSKRQFRRSRRLRLMALAGVIAVPLGGVALFSAAGDAVHHRPGGVVGVVFGVVLLVCGGGAFGWALRFVDSVTAVDWQDLRARGGDDGLPRGSFRQGQWIGLEASDRLLIFGVVATGVGVVFLVAGVTDPRGSWPGGLAFSLVGFLPAALFFRLGSGVRYWLTPDGVAKRARLDEAVRWAEVERIVPMRRGVPVPAGDDPDAFELQVGNPSAAGRRRWLGSDFTLKLLLVEIDRDDLLPLLQKRVPLPPKSDRLIE